MLDNYRIYLNSLDNIQIMLDGLPDLDKRSLEFYEKLYNLVDDETDRVTELLAKEEAKMMKNKKENNYELSTS